MNIEDRKVKKAKPGKMPSSPIKAPQGFKKGAGGALGQYTGGLDPTVVAPKAGIAPGRMAAVILRGYGTDGQRRGGEKGRS